MQGSVQVAMGVPLPADALAQWLGEWFGREYARTLRLAALGVPPLDVRHYRHLEHGEVPAADGTYVLIASVLADGAGSVLRVDTPAVAPASAVVRILVEFAGPITQPTMNALLRDLYALCVLGVAPVPLAPADAPSPPARERRNGSHVPSSQKVLQRWRTTWRLVQPEVAKGRPYTEIVAWLRRAHPHLACTERTLSDIVAAGERGDLGA